MDIYHNIICNTGDFWSKPDVLCVICLIQENEFTQANNYADLAVNSDRYNPSALTNKGNTLVANGEYEKAAEFYKESLRNDSSCTEALYNIGRSTIFGWR